MAVTSLALPPLQGRARAAWLQPWDLTYNTAYTLDPGQLEFGLVAPLQYGATDRLQLAIHPILFLLGAPSIATRWRFTRNRALTFALNVGINLSVLERQNTNGSVCNAGQVVDADGDGEPDPCGFPGTLGANVTGSWAISERFVVSAGLGPAADFLASDFTDLEHVRLLVSGHANALWLLDTHMLLMLQLSGNLNTSSQGDRLLRSAAQLMFAYAWDTTGWGTLHAAAGVAVGSFPIRTSDNEETTWPVFPVVDLWLRL